MANTYKKVYIHLVFAVKNRKSLLAKEWRNDVFSYISGIITKKGHFPIAVNGHLDHIHILFDYNLNELIPDLVREIKKSSSVYIKTNNLTSIKFEWQSGYGVFSVGWRDKSIIQNYIIKQEEHHKKKSFQDEYLSLLNKYHIDFKDEYVFEFYKD